jgi:hypothetical protein
MCPPVEFRIIDHDVVGSSDAADADDVSLRLLALDATSAFLLMVTVQIEVGFVLLVRPANDGEVVHGHVSEPFQS